MEFPLASRLHLKNQPRKAGIESTAGTLYSADLAGAFLGAVSVGALLIPILGIFSVCLLVGGINLLSALIVRRGQ